jgi:Ribbon-helix-helix protein, copG family.
MATNVRIQPQSYAKLRQIAEQSGVTMPQVLAEAIDNRYRQWLLEGLSADYARLRADPKAWAAELKERELWDRTLGDGLKGF